MASLYEDEMHAKFYSKYRPVFPVIIFEDIVNFYDAGKGNTCYRDLAVDVGCGNGQSTVPLCEFFKKVIGCDISRAQIELANTGVSNVSYEVCSGEDMQFLENESTDLVTVFTALHWLDLNRFYVEVERVLKPGGVLAVVTYKNPKIEPQDTKDVIYELYEGILKPYWDKRFQLWRDHYKAVPSPFENWVRTEPDDTKIVMDVSADGFVGLAKTLHCWHGFLKANPESHELENWKQKLNRTCRGKSIKLEWPVFTMMCRKPLP